MKARLSAMMFLEFATWGAWLPLLGNHLTRLGFRGPQVSAVYGTGALATMAAPLVAGQIADRWFATERFLAFAHAGAAVFFWLAAQASTFQSVYADSLIAMLFYAPTLGLTSSLAMRNLDDPKRTFPRIRSFGTIGWITAGLAMTAWFALHPNRPLGDCLRAGALIAAVHAVFSLVALPRTPPVRTTGTGARAPAGHLALASVLGLLREPSFAIFAALAFTLMFVLNFYYTFTGTFFEKGLGITAGHVPSVMAVGQIAEIATLFLLPAVHRRLGTKRTLAIGVACWALRFGAFALGHPIALVVAFQALHGVCFGFVFVVAMVYVDRVAPPDVRGTAQSFLSFLTYGAGMFVGSFVAAWVSAAATGNDGGIVWSRLFLYPCAGAVAMLVALLVGFRPAPQADEVSVPRS